VLKTARLTLSPFAADDAVPLFEMLRDGNAMKYTYVASTLEECTARLQAWESRRARFGYAPWVVRLTDSGAIIGWGGLGNDPADPHWGAEVIYAFAPSAWGKGIASELVTFAVSLGLRTHQLDHVDAFVHPDNMASHRVLQRNGFTPLGFEPALHRDRYRLSAKSVD
jgi:[ribosomal protein S5]-alanine N-acetyltransferase